MKLTPKLKFQEQVEYARAHRELVASSSFRTAIESALAQMVLDSGERHGQEEAAAQWNRIEGARVFIDHLLNLAEKPELPRVLPPANLDHSLR